MGVEGGWDRDTQELREGRIGAGRVHEGQGRAGSGPAGCMEVEER